MSEDTLSPAPKAPEDRKFRRLRLALICSLAVNLLVIGMVSGAVINFRKSGGERVSAVDGPNPFLRAMNREDARQLRGAVNAAIGSPHARRAESRRTMQALLDELRAETFSPDGLTQAFQALNNDNSKRIVAGQQAMLDYLLSMDAEARADFATRLEEAVTRGPRNGPRGNGTDRPQPRP